LLFTNNKDIKIIKRISTIRNKKILPLLNLYFDLKKTSFEKKHLKEINKKTQLHYMFVFAYCQEVFIAFFDNKNILRKYIYKKRYYPL
jgi:hypothetical protein